MLSDDQKITVCSACLRACCWQGYYMCDTARSAGTVEKTVAELRELNLEDGDWWPDSIAPRDHG